MIVENEINLHGGGGGGGGEKKKKKGYWLGNIGGSS